MDKKIIIPAIVIVGVIVGVLTLSGCTKKYIHEGEFTSIKQDGKYWDGVFKSSTDGEDYKVYGENLKYVKENVHMRVTLEYLGGYRLIFYEYLEEIPTEKEMVYTETFVETSLTEQQQHKISFVDWFRNRFPLRYKIYEYRFNLING